MPEDWMKHVIHSLGHTARHERAHGNHKGASALTLIAFGLFLLPIPIIGLPMILMGIWKLFK